VVISRCVPNTLSYLDVHFVNKLDVAVREVYISIFSKPRTGYWPYEECYQPIRK